MTYNMKSKLHPDQKAHHLIIILFFNAKSISLFCKDILSFIMVLFFEFIKNSIESWNTNNYILV